METVIYNDKGKEAGKLDLPKEIFGLPWNSDLVHQVAVSMQSNERETVAHTKDRGQVRGGGIKPWRQKGTGRARHGSSRSPIWVGGGITHGPNNLKNYSRKVNKKMKTKALFTLLSRKYKDGELIFIDVLSFDGPKAKRAKEVISSLGKVKGFENISTKRKNAAYIALAEKDANITKSFGNFGNIEVDELRNINVLDVLKHKFVVLSDAETALKMLDKRLNDTRKKVAA